MVKINSPYNLVEVLFQRKYPGYLYRREIVDDSDYGGDGRLKMVNCYSDFTGDWIGDSRMARSICKKRGIRFVQKSDCGRSIGFNPEEQKWAGWSHRGICCFGIGDKIFEECYGNDDTPFVQHGKVTIETFDQAKQAAINFSEYVS